VTSPLLPRLHHSLWLQLSGALLVLTGYILLQQSFKTLGNNYSPLFDAYLPEQLVTTGHYQQIRHPVYLYNLFVSFGLALSSGLWLPALDSGLYCAQLPWKNSISKSTFQPTPAIAKTVKN